MDRSESFNSQGGPVAAEVKSALFNIKSNATVINYIYGLGGRDVKVENIEEVFEDLINIDKTKVTGDLYRYLSVRE